MQKGSACCLMGCRRKVVNVAWRVVPEVVRRVERDGVGAVEGGGFGLHSSIFY